MVEGLPLGADEESGRTGFTGPRKGSGPVL